MYSIILCLVPLLCCLQQLCLVKNVCWAEDYHQPFQHWKMAIPDPTEKLQVSYSHTTSAPHFKVHPHTTKNDHPPLISTLNSRRKLTDHTSTQASLNLKCGTFIQTQRKLIRRIQINRDDDNLYGVSLTGISALPIQKHTANLIVCHSFSPNPALFPSFSVREKNRKWKWAPLRWGMCMCN